MRKTNQRSESFAESFQFSRSKTKPNIPRVSFILEIRYDFRVNESFQGSGSVDVSLEKREVFPNMIGIFKTSVDFKINRTLEARTTVKKLSLPEPSPIRARSFSRDQSGTLANSNARPSPRFHRPGLKDPL